MNKTEKLFPSPQPHGEAPAESPAFVDACMSIASDRAAALGWQLGKSALTQNDVWGLVWRIDFAAKGHREGSQRVNRMICWGTEEGIVLGTATMFGEKPLLDD